MISGINELEADLLLYSDGYNDIVGEVKKEIDIKVTICIVKGEIKLRQCRNNYNRNMVTKDLRKAPSQE